MSMDTIVDIDSPSHAKNPSFSGMKNLVSGSNPTNPTHARGSKKNVLSDKYVLGEELGRGAYGQVFKGLDTRTGDVVAIKRLSLSGISQDNLQNIMTEIELLKNLNHKHIVKYMGSFKTRTHLYIVLEYMENGALSGVIKPNKFGAFPEPLVAVCIEQVLQGLAYLHEQGVVHRDIKGANILTTKEGLVKLADFGVAAKLGELEEDRDFRDSVVGTPYWMAPEVIEMTGVTAASDIWSVACLAIELLTGQPPYYDLQPMSALFRIVQDNHPQLPPDISPQYEDFLTQCFQKDPQKRPDAKKLLQHPWISFNRKTLRSSWNRTRGSNARGGRTEAHLSVTAVVERILQADAANHPVPSGVPEPEPALSPGPPAAKKPPLPPSASDRTVRDSATEQVSAADSRGRSDSQDELYNTASSYDLEPRLQQMADENSTGESPTASHQRKTSGGSSPLQPTPSSTTPMSSTSQTSAARAEGTPPARSSELRRAQSRSDALGNMFTTRNSSGREPPDSPLEAILERLGHATPLPDAHKLGRDLMGWADDSERSPNSKAVGQGGEGMVGDDLMRSKREDAVEVRHLVRDLRLPLGENRLQDISEAGARAPEEAAHLAVQSLIHMLKNNGERLASFMAEGGHVTVLELLTSKKHELFLPTLQLVNVLVSSENRILEQFCLMGLVPVILKFAVRNCQPKFDDGSWRAVRFEAALFVQHMCYTSSETARVLVACQAIPTLVDFVEEDFSRRAVLTHIGISCIWRLLEVHRALPLRVMCRLLAQSDLAHRLVLSLSAVMLRYKELKQSAEEASKKASTPRQAALSFTPQSTHTPGFEDQQKGLLADSEDSSRADAVAQELRNAHASAKEDTSSSTGERHTGGTKNGRLNRGEAVHVNALPNGSSHHTRDCSLRLETLSPLMERMCDLLLVLSHASTEVKEAMCRETTLRMYYTVIQVMAELRNDDLLLKCVRVIKHLTQDPAVLKPLENANTIEQIMPYLTQKNALPEVQLEVLHSLYNMCKISKERQEAAAKAGIVPTLIKFALPPQEYDPTRAADADDKREAMRPLAVSLLCQMAHTSNRTRTLLWNSDGLTVLLALLKDEVWQAGALDAVAAWLNEDREHQVEPRLFQKDALTKFVLLFQEKIVPGDMDTLVRQLAPFLKIMKRSPRFTVEIAQHGFIPVVLELLKKPHAEARRKLLAVIHVIYEHYPRPKELILKYHLQEHLKRLVAGNRTGQAILVQKQAQRLLDAFQINMVL